MSDIEIDYQYLADRALRRVVRDVLEMTADLRQTPGDHHFYIEFDTQAPGVEIPEKLLADYPSRMTIVLQHQYEDLAVTDESFAVTLRFDGAPYGLVVPYDAITNFVDPSVRFQLHFAALNDDAEAPTAHGDDAAPDNAASGDANSENEAPDLDPDAKRADTAPSAAGQSGDSAPAQFTPAPKGAAKRSRKSDDDDTPPREPDGDVVSLDAFRKK